MTRLTRVTQPFPNFIQGVSQQPPALRFPSQVEELVNGYASAAEGLTKRPHTSHVAQLASTAAADAKIHAFNKTSDEQGYVILKGDGTISVKGFDGTEANITMSAATDYIDNSSNPATDFEVVTVADYTFIVNRTMTPALKADTYYDKDTAGNGYGSTLVWVRTPQLEVPYNITLTGGTGVNATYNPGSTSANANTENIATELKTDIHGNGSPAFTATTIGSVLSIHRSGNAYDITVTDGLGNNAMVLIQKAVQSVADLPPNAPDRFQVEVVGDESTNWDNFWLEWNTTKKAWIECPAPGRQYKIDPATMPHVLRYVSPGEYVFEQVAWNDCPAGDTTTNPVPSFIGRAIQDMFFYRGRLGLVTEASVVLSEAGSIYNFWRSTVTSLVDSDPIDVKVSMTNPSPLRWAVEYNESVFFFSASQQYYIEKGVEILSPKTIAIRSPTEYEVDVTSQPIVVGDRIYYARQRALHSSLHDYYPKADAEGKLTFGSDEVTSHAPRYIEGRVRQLKGNSQGDAIIMLVDNDEPHAYVFQTAFSDKKRIQAAIHRWEFDASNLPLTVESTGSSLYFVMSRSDGLYLEQCDLSPKAVDPGMPIKLLLDQRMDETLCSVSFDSGSEKSTITLPVDDSNDEDNPYVMYARSASSQAQPGELIPLTMLSNNPVQFEVDGNWTSEEFYVGKPYNFEMTFSEIILRNTTTGAPLTGGRLQIGRIFLNYGDTGYFRVTVSPSGRDTSTYVLTGYQIGSAETLLSEFPLLSGTFKFPVLSNSQSVEVKVISDAPFPLKLLNGDWEGQFGSQAVQAARRL